MKITAHFYRSEFDSSDGRRYPARWVRPRLLRLCRALEVLRAELGGRSMSINSGYRSPALNRRIGGARRSQHMAGRAADISVKGVSPKRVHAVALRLHREGKLELGGLGLYGSFTHLDVRNGRRLARWSGSRKTNAVV